LPYCSNPSLLKDGGLDQHGAGPFEQQQSGTAGVEGVNTLTVQVTVLTKETNNLAMHRGRQVRDRWAYGCAVSMAYVNLNPGLELELHRHLLTLTLTITY